MTDNLAKKQINEAIYFSE